MKHLSIVLIVLALLVSCATNSSEVTGYTEPDIVEEAAEVFVEETVTPVSEQWKYTVNGYEILVDVDTGHAVITYPVSALPVEDVNSMIAELFDGYGYLLEGISIIITEGRLDIGYPESWGKPELSVMETLFSGAVTSYLDSLEEKPYEIIDLSFEEDDSIAASARSFAEAFRFAQENPNAFISINTQNEEKSDVVSLEEIINQYEAKETDWLFIDQPESENTSLNIVIAKDEVKPEVSSEPEISPVVEQATQEAKTSNHIRPWTVVVIIAFVLIAADCIYSFIKKKKKK